MSLKNIKSLALICLLLIGFLQTSNAAQTIPAFNTWCPGGEHLESLGNDSFLVNGKIAKSSTKNQSIYVQHNKLTYKVDQFQDGLQVTVSGREDASGQCSVKGAAAHVSPAERAGQGKFNATGQIPCAQYKSQPTRSCYFGVARDPGGNASVRVEIAKGAYRFITFENGKAIGADLSQADGDMSFSSKKEGDLYLIKAGKERYEIPEAVIFGG